MKRRFNITENNGFIDSKILTGIVQPGTIIASYAISVPEGYLFCNGATLNKNDYPELFNNIGYIYGGSGNNFNIPELRTRFIRGSSDNSNIDPEGPRNVGHFQSQSLKAHNHNPNIIIRDSYSRNHTHSYTSTISSESHYHSFRVSRSVFYPKECPDAYPTPVSSDGPYYVDNGGAANHIHHHFKTCYSPWSGSHTHTDDISVDNAGSTYTQPRHLKTLFLIKY